MHEAMQHTIYVQLSGHNEIVVTYAERGSELKPGDYITHADGIRVLNGGLKEFLNSAETEAVVPIIDDTDDKLGGKKLLGFVTVQPVSPRKISTRRGEIEPDMNEGGPPPSSMLSNIGGTVKEIQQAEYELAPPAHGTGPCITAKDCNFYNGTCVKGQCDCLGTYSGSFCQVSCPMFWYAFN